MSELLLEFLSEEIPARMQKAAAEQLGRTLASGVVCMRIACSMVTPLRTYVTPRRLVLICSQTCPFSRSDLREERKGPSTAAPQQAIEGFLKANGDLKMEDCVKKDTGKGEYFFIEVNEKGADVKDLLKDFPAFIFHKFNWPKSMKWGDYSHHWVRPLQSIMMVFDGKIVEGTLADIDLKFTDQTSGHRFMSVSTFPVSSFEDYQEKLRKAFVIIDRDERKARIAAAAEKIAEENQLQFKPDEGLLDEVCGLVEWPEPLMGSIDKEFMDVPAEVLITSMRVHQKYFPLYTKEGKLAPYFILVSNIKPTDGGKTIIAGNEKVLRARLSDAKFFWDQDRKKHLSSYLEGLHDMRFHDKLGSLAQKSERLSKLVGLLSADLLQVDHSVANKALAKAASLCKADLLTGMVGEFPELQGIMGGYYALEDQLHEKTAFAIRDHYKPAGAHDDLPESIEASLLSIADKLDSLVGFFTAGLKPTSSKDPFALRRACLGILRIVKENDFEFSLSQNLENAYKLYCEQHIFQEKKSKLPLKDIQDFFYDRLRVYLKDLGVRHDFIQAVFEEGDADNLRFVFKKIDALESFFQGDSAAYLLSLFKRANNILEIEENKDKSVYTGEIDRNYLQDTAETKLYTTLVNTNKSVEIALDRQDFEMAMTEISKLSVPVNDFFDKVMVNVEDQEIRVNRLQLLGQIRGTVNKIVRFSLIEER
jgi:glycyl-tRNA synthetase beta chain